jgi:2-iminoacetate synthase
VSFDPSAFTGADAWNRLQAMVLGAGEADVRRALGRERLQPADLGALLSRAAAPYLDEMAARATAVTLRRFGRTVVLYAPLYLSNECVNRCTYCGFAHERAVLRRTLDHAELLAEARRLRDEGFGHVLLLTGEDRKAAPVPWIADAVAASRTVFDSAAVEIYPLDRDGYASLVDAGCDGVTLYQESYDPEVYARVHPRGPKADYEGRMLAPARAAAAGMRWVSIGALLGLSDWRAEGLAMALHGRALRKAHWRTRLAIGFPRLRDDPGADVPLQPLDDRELTQLIVAMRLFLPDADLVLSTREQAALRDALVGVGITRMSAGSRTSPGGYALEADAGAGEQFAVTDRRTPAEVSAMLAGQGFEPVWKDWDRAF